MDELLLVAVVLTILSKFGVRKKVVKTVVRTVVRTLVLKNTAKAVTTYDISSIDNSNNPKASNITNEQTCYLCAAIDTVFISGASC